MITDKQGQEWVLQKLYDAGWRYLVVDNHDNVYLTSGRPFKYDGGDEEIRISICGKYAKVNDISKMLPELKCNEWLDIAEELDIVDWSKVAVDTPILVKGLGLAEWQNRYFAFFKDGEVYAWCNGATSWSCKNSNDVSSWKYAKLAEV